MARDITQSAVFYLIEAGQLARQKLARPLLEKGLLPGDEAVLLCLKRRRAIGAPDLCQATGLDAEGLAQRLSRLRQASMIVIEDGQEGAGTAVRISKKGRRFVSDLVAQWEELDAVLLGDLKPKQARRFARTLDRFVDLLLF